MEEGNELDGGVPEVAVNLRGWMVAASGDEKRVSNGDVGCALRCGSCGLRLRLRVSACVCVCMFLAVCVCGLTGWLAGLSWLSVLARCCVDGCCSCSFPFSAS